MTGTFEDGVRPEVPDSTTPRITSSSLEHSVPASTSQLPNSIQELEIGTCQVMGPGESGWEILLGLPAVLGSGAYEVTYVLRGPTGALLDRINLLVSLRTDESLTFWDSPPSDALGVTNCEVTQLRKGNDSCDIRHGCSLSAAGLKLDPAAY